MNVTRIAGQIISAVIIQYLQWRYVYIVCAAAAFLRFLNVTLIHNIEMKRKSFDWIGSVLIVILLACLCMTFMSVA